MVAATSLLPASADTVSDKAREAGQLSTELDAAKQHAGELGADYLHALEVSAKADAELDAAQAAVVDATAREANVRRRVSAVALDLYIAGTTDKTVRMHRALVTGTDAAASVYIESATEAQDALMQEAAGAKRFRQRQSGRAADAADVAKSALHDADKARQDALDAQSDLQQRYDHTQGELAAAVAEQQALMAEAAKARLEAAVPTGDAPLADPRAATTVSFALGQLGKPYLWGGAGPDSFDCSGLTSKAWAGAGITIPRVAADQQNAAIPIAISEGQPGDLVFFGSPAHHVGLYLGDGLMIDAPQTGEFVRIEPVWWSDLAGIGRVAQLPPTAGS